MRFESKALRKKINFNFLSSISISQINNLKKNTIIQLINVLNYKEKQISFLKEEISFKRIEEQIQSKTVESKIKT